MGSSSVLGKDGQAYQRQAIGSGLDLGNLLGGDADGAVTGTADIPVMDQSDWIGIIENFLGEIEQVPPMYSALKLSLIHI